MMTKAKTRYSGLESLVEDLESNLTDLLSRCPPPESESESVDLSEVDKRLYFLKNLVYAEFASNPENTQHLRHISHRLDNLDEAFRDWESTVVPNAEDDSLSTCSCDNYYNHIINGGDGDDHHISSSSTLLPLDYLQNPLFGHRDQGLTTPPTSTICGDDDDDTVTTTMPPCPLPIINNLVHHEDEEKEQVVKEEEDNKKKEIKLLIILCVVFGGLVMVLNLMVSFSDYIYFLLPDSEGWPKGEFLLPPPT